MSALRCLCSVTPEALGNAPPSLRAWQAGMYSSWDFCRVHANSLSICCFAEGFHHGAFVQFVKEAPCITAVCYLPVHRAVKTVIIDSCLMPIKRTVRKRDVAAAVLAHVAMSLKAPQQRGLPPRRGRAERSQTR